MRAEGNDIDKHHQHLHKSLRFRDLTKITTYLYLFLSFKWPVAKALFFAGVKHSALLFIPLFISLIIDKAIPQRDISSLGLYAAAMCLTILLNVITTRFYIIHQAHVLRTVARNLRSFLCHRLQQLSVSFYDRNHSGKLYSKLMLDVDRLNQFGSFLFEPLAVSLMVGSMMVGICLYKEPRVTLFLCFSLPLFIALNRFFRKRLKRNQQRMRSANEMLSAGVAGMLQTIRLARAHGREDAELAKLETRNLQWKQAGEELDRTVVTLGASIWSVGQFTIVLILIASAWAAMQQPPLLTIGEVTLFLAYFERITGFLNSIVSGYDRYIMGKDALASLGEIANCPDREDNEGKPAMWDVKGGIAFRDVDFTYRAPGAWAAVPHGNAVVLDAEDGFDSPNSRQSPFDDIHEELRPHAYAYALRNVNVDIEPGEHIALVGPSGSGKSTFISLVLGFYRPTRGSILIDGRDIREIDMRSVRRSVGVVSQDNVLFDGTVRENITHGEERYSEQDVMEAAHMANAHDFIMELDQGYETRVGERGATLSGGQRQRIAIARALLRDPAILLLDEATSALDLISEKEVQEALVRVMEGRTTITIAHRLSTIRNAGRILVFENGSIIEVGDHDTLLRQSDGVYSRLIALQEALR